MDQQREVNSFLFSFDWMKNDACEVAVNPRGDSHVNSKISEVFNQSPDRDGFSLQITSVFTDTFFSKHNLKCIRPNSPGPLTDDSSVNFHDKFFLHFLLKFSRK